MDLQKEIKDSFKPYNKLYPKIYRNPESLKPLLFYHPALSFPWKAMIKSHFNNPERDLILLIATNQVLSPEVVNYNQENEQIAYKKAKNMTASGKLR